ncbi:MAG: hypothetical protein UX16_C0003G0018 [Parcubacteria group bacterium GW2011_GWB1_45_7]|uniref:Cell division protein FtsL n=2 Tax=Candidatus Colwelliibacteriota TaxID=1817904 RepID=A0A1G1ZDH6_9BACT|nr:MAG: hypothetical protein UX16_C0003G0018 [Parcubacteria group bacterium GW2011_GWB1_45_7]OGY58426.1 MAG: hypothetical protein A3C03_01315 [Candidatus Colwellbacteria bacterium RIFCSPHIGHO2_02_FULL_45_17]OGY60678.1 MAG: hypothetical protein A3I33_01920 [Candidatus Colwellbacteria bacterium RIFCSPLOWO2_02_FULL_45_11]OGY62661.1 MAG: hypothetical protein A3G58_00630 [Candidatus Colwellbacteria bacterium RIFCSPLOWO2_12_FULL_46_17]
MKRVIYIIFIVVFVAIAFEVYKVDSQRRELEREMATLVNEIELVEGDNSNITEKIEFFSEARNLEKELRARFNYRLPFEKLIIVIPEE